MVNEKNGTSPLVHPVGTSVISTFCQEIRFPVSHVVRAHILLEIQGISEPSLWLKNSNVVRMSFI